MRRIVAIVLVACGGGPPAVAVRAKTPPVSKPVEPPACIAPPEEAAPINHASGDESRVAYCIGTGVSQCFALELATAKLVHLAEAPKSRPDQGAHVETTNPELKVCTDGSCKALTPQIWPGAAPLHAATNGSFAVVLLGDTEAGKGYADVYDVSKAKKLATFKYARGDFKCGEVAMLGETIYLGTSTCTGPSGRATLYSTKGKKIANVGGKEFGTFGNAYVQVDGAKWAFLDENGTKITVQDVVTGKVVKTLDASELFRRDDSKESIGNPGESTLIRLTADKLGVIGGSPANGSVAVVDVTSGEVKVIRAPFCQER